MTDAPLPPALPPCKTLRERVTDSLLASPFEIYRDKATGHVVLVSASWERVRFWVMDDIGTRITKRRFDAIAANLPI